MSLLAEIPWARRVWALPFLCTLAHSERYAKECAKRHKPLTEWAGQLLVLVRRAGAPSARSWLSPTVGGMPP